MESERWRKVRVLFDEAISLEDAKRRSFLANACGDDEELRRECEILLDSFSQADGFMEQPAAHDIADLIVGQTDSPGTGDRINHYEIVSSLGEGGMGEVYQAKDTRLDRMVALKLLAAHITEDKDRVSRFRQEALATSALNHPNIITIYEIGEWQDRDFIAAEYIDGRTLRDKLKAKKLSLGEALDIALQTASALSAAHDAGIIHRDIKPENIMIRKDGLVKVLDFGIAKYTPSENGRKALVNTRIGEIIGTAAYMSPEQARGLNVDERTDIWSLGVILYEMITRRLPFGGGTRSDRIVAILEREPTPIGKLRHGTPPELERIVQRALEKKRQDRYKKMADLAEDLQKVRDRSGLASRSRFTFPSIGRSPRLAWHSLSLPLILVIAVGAVWIYLSGGGFGATDRPMTLQSMKIARLSDTSQAEEVAVSPDGEYVAFIKLEGGKRSIWLRQVSATSSIQIVPPVEGTRYDSPVFSPDGRNLYYLKAQGESPRATLYQVPKLGGNEIKLAADISSQDSASNFSISPDGRQVAFIRLDEGFNRSLVIADLDGRNERRLISRVLPDFLTGAAWSPNGEVIACFAGTFGGRGGFGYKPVVLVNVKDGTERSLSEKQWWGAAGLAWLPDSSGLIVSASEKPGPVQMWHISNPRGVVSRITNDLSDYGAPSVMTNTSTIVAVQINKRSNIWIASLDQNNREERQLTFGNGGKDGETGLSFTPDGRLVFTSQASGNSDIWILNSDTATTRQLTVDAGANSLPSVSPNGEHIVFNSDRAGEGGIWRTGIDGGNPTQLTTGTYPTFSPDGRSVIFYRAGTLWRIAIEGGEPVQIPTQPNDKATAAVISPDNLLIACNYLVGEPNAQFRIGVLPVEGGPALKVFDILSNAARPVRWIPHSRTVSFIETRDGVSNIFSQAVTGEKPVPVTNFRSGLIWNFAWSNDGTRIALARGSIARDVVLISEFK